MKVAELNPPGPDYWVAKAEGWPGRRRISWGDSRVCQIAEEIDPAQETVIWENYSPSTDWSQGGPIIEREDVKTLFMDDKGWHARVEKWAEGKTYHGHGPTPLIAAMRAYCASKFGEEVPDEK